MRTPRMPMASILPRLQPLSVGELPFGPPRPLTITTP